MRFFGLYKMKETNFKAIWVFKENDNARLCEEFDKLKGEYEPYHKSLALLEVSEELIEALEDINKDAYLEFKNKEIDEMVFADEISEHKYMIIKQMIKE